MQNFPRISLSQRWKPATHAGLVPEWSVEKWWIKGRRAVQLNENRPFYWNNTSTPAFPNKVRLTFCHILIERECRERERDGMRERTGEKWRERQPKLLGNQSAEEQRGRTYTPPAARVCLRGLDCLREEWWCCWWGGGDKPWTLCMCLESEIGGERNIVSSVDALMHTTRAAVQWERRRGALHHPVFSFSREFSGIVGFFTFFYLSYFFC